MQLLVCLGKSIVDNGKAFARRGLIARKCNLNKTKLK